MVVGRRDVIHMEKVIHKVVLTGGVCAGKSSALTRIKEHFTERGWYVIIVPESATTLINAGVTPYRGNNQAFQYELILAQNAMETLADDYARRIADARILIVFDRGIPDGEAFTEPISWSHVLGSQKMSRFEARDERYGMVLHLETVAKGKPEFYTLENNTARTESIEDAIKVDDRLIDVWTGHPHLRIIDNSTDFHTKINRCIKEIANFIGDPTPIETERKFLVKLKNVPDEVKKTAAEIVQTYLKSSVEETERVRRYNRGENWMFIHTTKKQISDKPNSRYEVERLLDFHEYLDVVGSRPNPPSVKKSRMYKWSGKHYLEIDVYTECKQNDDMFDGWAILEIETSEDDTVTLPDYDWMEIVKEVTDDPKWKNCELAI